MLKLGKLPPKHDIRTFEFSRYFDASVLPAFPPAQSWSTKVKDAWPMMLNDRLGDCAIAAPGHTIQLWTSAMNKESVPNDQAILKAYSDVSGYNPKTGEYDQGCVMLDVMNYWRNKGIGKHKINAFVNVRVARLNYIMAATYLFGACQIGLNLPISASNQFDSGKPWDVVSPDSGDWGGHAVPIVDYSPDGLVCVTWGKLQKITWAFFKKYCDEAYAAISSDWLDKQNKSPSGFNLTQLQQDILLLK